MSFEERKALRALIDQKRREKLSLTIARINPDRDPHPRREYWREYKRRKAAA